MCVFFHGSSNILSDLFSVIGCYGGHDVKVKPFSICQGQASELKGLASQLKGHASDSSK